MFSALWKVGETRPVLELLLIDIIYLGSFYSVSPRLALGGTDSLSNIRDRGQVSKDSVPQKNSALISCVHIEVVNMG